ncbi:SpaN/EivJ family type III secretion system needle length determinant [Tatumella ptyseos]|uniref:SpaN/EivJ family type III secretion system needle length determinant n=1 Tax=Tatumella ptyseos TaxID=82987 RepID=UPI0026EC1631|nr:hypothetical protein [Tatumella ptyseos]WKX25756.1 hypothetical protein QJR74_10580 [Tatumella ptyseos]
MVMNINKVKSYTEINFEEALGINSFQQWINKKIKKLEPDPFPEIIAVSAILSSRNDLHAMNILNGTLSAADDSASQENHSLIIQPKEEDECRGKKSNLFTPPLIAKDSTVSSLTLGIAGRTPKGVAIKAHSSVPHGREDEPSQMASGPSTEQATQISFPTSVLPPMLPIISLPNLREDSDTFSLTAQQLNRLHPLQTSLKLKTEQNRLEVNYVFQRWPGEHSVNITMPLQNGQGKKITLLPSDSHSAEILSKHLNQLNGFSSRLLDPEQDKDNSRQSRYLPQQDEDQE